MGFSHQDLLYHNSSNVRVHNQGFEILHFMHFPPTLVPSQLLDLSLEPNWILSVDVMADEWGFVKRYDVPWQSDWNKAFNSFHHSIFH